MTTNISDASGLYHSLMTAPSPILGNYKLTNDITMVGSGFSSTSIPQFSGNFDGSGYTITIDINVLTSPYQGLFQYVDASGTVQNLNVRYTSTGITGITTSISGALFFGLLAGDNQGTIQSNSVVFDSSCNIITLTSTTNEVDYGGLIGRNLNNANLLNNSLDICGNFTLNVSSNSFAFCGGLVGNNDTNSNITNISGTFNNNVLYNINSANLISSGGLCGRNSDNSDISGCSIIYNETLTMSKSSIITNPACFYGGLFGFNRGGTPSNIYSCSGTFKNLYINNIVTRNSVGAEIGSIVGRNQISLIDNVSSIIQNEYRVNNITSPNTKIGGQIGNNFRGSSSKYIGNCNSNIYTINIYNTNNIVDPTGTCYIGSLFGAIINDITIPLDVSGCSLNNTQFICDISSNPIPNIYFGGLFGSITQLSFSGSGFDVISNCSANIGNLNTKVYGINSVYIGGIVGGISDTSSLVIGLKLTNNTLNLGPNSYFESLNDATSVLIGGLAGGVNGDMEISNNTIIYGDKLTLKAKETTSPKTLFLNSNIGGIIGTPTLTNNIGRFVLYDLRFSSIGTTATGITFNGVNYPVPPPPNITTIYGGGFNIDLSDITLYIYLYNPPPVIETPPCCVANTINPNPQTTDYDTSIKANNKNNSTLVKSVELYNEAISSGIRTAFSQPVFSSYHAYIQYLQGKNKR